MKYAGNKGKETPGKNQEDTVKEKVHRHLNNKNDIITEEDIRDTLTDNKIPEKDTAETKKKTE